MGDVMTMQMMLQMAGLLGFLVGAVVLCLAPGLRIGLSMIALQILSRHREASRP